jgi:selenide,water dikinase
MKKDIPQEMQDILYDPQTSGGLMIAVSEKESAELLRDLKAAVPCAQIVGYVTEQKENAIILE